MSNELKFLAFEYLHVYIVFKVSIFGRNMLLGFKYLCWSSWRN